MRRDDDDDSGPDGAKTSRAMQALGHGASGGHVKGPSKAPGTRSALARTNRHQWDHIDPDSAGGDMSYSYQEYPKHVTVNGRLFVCNSEAEEHEALKTGGLVKEDDERKRLVALAEVKGVQVDKRWGLAKMEKALTDAGYDASADPFA